METAYKTKDGKALKSMFSFPDPIEDYDPVYPVHGLRAIDHGSGDHRTNYSFKEYRPFELHLLPDAAVGDKPVLAVGMVDYFGQKVIGQISIEMFNSALVQLGYQIIKF